MLRKPILLIILLTSSFLLTVLHAQDQHFTLNTVVIDAGHGGKDPGTVFGTLYEKDIVLEVALQAGKMISEKNPGVKVIYTRTKDVFVPLDQRANIANKAKADLFISIHVNYYQKETAFGAETYILGTHRSEDNLKVAQLENSVILLEDDYTTRYEGFDPNSAESYIMFELIQNEYLEQSRFFADKVQQSFKQLAQRHNRGVKQAGFLVLRKTVMPGILIELGYISNSNDRSYLATPKGQTSLAQSIADAFATYKKRIDSRSNILLSESPETTKDADHFDSTFVSPASKANNAQQLPKQNTSTSETGKTINEQAIRSGEWYAIQIMASSKPMNADKLGIDKTMLVHQLFENNFYKYYTGFTQNLNEATENQQRLDKQFKGAFIVVFRNGQKEKFRKL
ncbi:MAG: N-acetylmuramoyl-L-alanine amidase [Prolixibacteraceae bacterium]|nr:N-acetylmuramoyl-L-alanine amidase [Prolixibacteraceae bacterium]